MTGSSIAVTGSPRAERDRGGPPSVRDQGAVIIEFAMISPVLIMLVLGLVQIGLLLSQQQSLNAAAREGARTASFPGSSQTDIETAVANAYSTSFGPSPAVTVTPDVTQPCLNRQGLEVTVDVALTASLDIPFLAGQTVQLDSAGVFRCE